jgi:Hsp70 protein/putative pyrroloquinoline-quinone binding quinoprotein
MGTPGEGFVLGVDLGTSHTVAMLRRPDGRTRPLLFDGRPLLPSAVFLDATGRLHVGQDALRLGHAEPGRIEPNPKRHVDDDEVLLGAAGVPVTDLFAALLRTVADEAVATAGFLPPAVLTYPAAWGPPRRAVLTAALAKAGWPAATRLVAEPIAAAHYFADVLRRPLPAGSSLAVFDFGAGTLDIAVVRNDGPDPDGRPVLAVTASGGADDLGGLDLDAALVDHLGKSLAGAEPEAWHALTEPVTLAQWRARRQFWQDVRGAKEMLSRSAFAPVPVPGVEHAVHLTRDELEAAADPLIRRGVAQAGAVLSASGVEPADLAGLFLVGGSSRVPLVARLLHSELGIAPTVLEQPELPVAEGATIVATEPPVRFTQGVVPAATPTPTPATSPNSPPPITDTQADRPVPAPPAASADDRQYADPVDPWATGEAAALAAGGHAPFPSAPPGASAFAGPSAPTPTPPWLASTSAATAPRKRGRRAYLIIAAAVTVVLAVSAAGIWYFWPGYRALDYHPLSDPRRFAPLVPVDSSWSDAQVLDDRAYFASSDSRTGQVGVVAVDTDATKPAWRSDQAGTATSWNLMVALPIGVALFSAVSSTSGKRELVVLGAADGKRLWHRAIGPDDEVFFFDDVAVLVDRVEHRLVGLRLSDGNVRWDKPDPKTDAGTTTLVEAVTTPEDQAGPASATGRPLAPDRGDDQRLVQISADRSARVYDATNGKVLASRQIVASTSDEIIAHNDRLFVRESGSAKRILAYDLDKLALPKILYTAQAENNDLSHLATCGDDRICFVEEAGGDAKAAEVVAVSATDGLLWRKQVAGANRLVPVGESVLATASDDTTTLLDPDGSKLWSNDWVVARLDGGNVLEFPGQLSGYPEDPSMAGQHIGDTRVELGPAADIRTATCSWNTSVLACVADTDFVLRDFA